MAFLLRSKSLALLIGLFLISASSALAQLHRPGDPPTPRTALDDRNDLISTGMITCYLTIAVLAIAWLIFWSFRKMRHARLHKNR